MTIAQDQVAAGIEWLNEHAPAEWWDRVDYDTLNLDVGTTCVLGQVFAEAAAEMGLISGYHAQEYLWPETSNGHWQKEHGFLAVDTLPDTLREAWIDQIETLKFMVTA